MTRQAIAADMRRKAKQHRQDADDEQRLGARASGRGYLSESKAHYDAEAMHRAWARDLNTYAAHIESVGRPVALAQALTRDSVGSTSAAPMRLGLGVLSR